MKTNEEMREKFFTEEGVKALDTKIKTMVSLFNKNIFPLNVIILGFSKLEIESREECLHRVKELCQILGAQCELETVDDGTTETERLKMIISNGSKEIKNG